MDKKALMEQLAQQAYEKGCFNGIWLYAENGKVVSSGAKGYRDEHDKLPMQEDSIFELASITKQFTAAAVMLLVRKGLLRLNDDVTEYFPTIPYKGATIRHLLTHTAGLPDIYDSEWIVDVWKKENKIPSNDIVVRYLVESGEEPLFAPGEKWAYSNTGYNLLAEIVQMVSGVPFEDFLQQNLFDPADMTSTGVYHLRRDGVPNDRFVRNLVLEDGKYILPDDSEDVDNYGVIAVDALNGDDYVYTTVEDMLKWDRALREEKVLTLAEQKLMWTPAVLNSGEIFEDDDGESYGFGWGIQEDPALGLVLNHTGGMPGLSTWYVRAIDADRVFVFLNSREYADVRGYWTFVKGMTAITNDQEPKPMQTLDDIIVKTPDKSKWASYCGKYEKLVEDFPIEEVYVKDGDLYCKVVWDEDDTMDCQLFPIGENVFGRKGGIVEIEFGVDCLTIDDITCKKVQE